MRRYLSAVIGASIAAIPVQAAETDLERRFGAQEGVTQVSLSPDGQLIAFVAPNKGLANDLYVARIGDGEAPHRILRASGDPETLRWCRWATDVCSADEPDMIERERAHAAACHHPRNLETVAAG